MKKNVKRMLVFLLTCFITLGSIPEMTVRSEDTDAVPETEVYTDETVEGESEDAVIETDEVIAVTDPEPASYDEPADTMEDTENPDAADVDVDDENTTVDPPEADTDEADDGDESVTDEEAKEEDLRTGFSITLSDGVYIENPKDVYAEGDEISLISFLDKNVLPRSMEILDENGNTVFWSSEDSQLHATFVMPKKDVTVTVTFSEMTSEESAAVHNGSGMSLLHQEAVMDSVEVETETEEEGTVLGRVFDKARSLASGLADRVKTVFAPIRAQASPADSGYFSMGNQINYASAGLGSGNWTNEFYINSNGTDYFGFCVNPSLYAPANGTYAIEDLTGNERLRKVLFYGYNGQVGGFLENAGVYGAAAQNIITHTALAKAYGDSSWSSGLNAAGINATNRYLELIDAAFAPTADQQKVYRLATPDSRQTIIFGEGQLLGSIWIVKQGIVEDDNGAKADYMTGSNTVVGGRVIQDNPNYNNNTTETGNYGGAEFTVFKDTGLLMSVADPKASDIASYEAAGLVQFIWFTAPTDRTGSTIFGPIEANQYYWLIEGKAPSGFIKSDDMIPVHTAPYVPSDTFPYGLSFTTVSNEVKKTQILIQKEDDQGNRIRCNPGQGAVFGLYQTQDDAAADTNYPAANPLRMETVETDANGDGLFTAKMLMGEEYWVKELRAPIDQNGKIYRLNSNPIRVVTANPDDPAATFGYTLVPVGNGEEGGNLQLFKESAAKDVTNGNAAYDMTGIQYQVLDQDRNPIAGKVMTITSYDAAASTGTSDVINLPVGQYYLQEVEASAADKAYQPDPAVHGPYDVKSTHTPALPLKVTVSEQIKSDPIDILLKKVDSSGNAVPVGNGELKDAQFSVKYYADTSHTTVESVENSGSPVRSWIFKTDQDGYVNYHPDDLVSGDEMFFNDATNYYEIPAGSLIVQETLPPKGYKINTEKFLIRITEAGVDIYNAAGRQMSNTSVLIGNEIADTGLRVPDDSIKGRATVKKTDSAATAAQGDASLSGIRFALVNRSANAVTYNGGSYASGCVVAILETNASGNASVPANSLDFGEYDLCELRSTASIAAGDVYDGSPKLGNESDVYAGRSGYLFKANTKRLKIEIDGQIASADFSDDIVRGGFQIDKQDRELNAKAAQGDADFNGIQFKVTNKSSAKVIVNGTTFEKNEAVHTFTVDAAGGYTSPSNLLPYGTYEIQEIAANGSYLLTDGTPRTIQIRENGKIVTMDIAGEELAFKNNVIRGGFKIEKWDRELDAKAAQGDADFSGVEFNVYNKSKGKVVVGGKTFDPDDPKPVHTFSTNAAGDYTSENDLLPFGTYEIKEAAKDGSYLLTDGAPRTIEIRENGVIVSCDPSGEKLVFKNDVVRGGVSFLKVDAETMTAVGQGTATLAGAEITIKNASAASVIVNGTTCAPGEDVLTVTTAADGTAQTAADALPYGTYTARETLPSNGYKLNTDWTVTFTIRENGVIVNTGEANPLPEELIRADLIFIKVNENGAPMANIPFAVSRLDTDGNPVETHVIVTDANGYASTADRAKDDTVNTLDDCLSGARFTDESALDPAVNVWFGAGTPAAGKGSLIPGNYLLEELQCEANRGQVMLKQTILTDPFTDGKRYLAGNVFVDLNIETESQLTDKGSGNKSAAFDAAAELTDVVKYNHLKANETYRAETEIFYVDRAGTKTAVGITDMTFTAASAKKTVENTVTVDTSAMKGGMLHAVDRLYMNWRGEEILIDTHNTDFSEEAQTVYVPYMRTQAADAFTGDHVGAASETAKISDRILYEGLADSKLYHAEGILHDADSGEIVKDASGADCKADRILHVSYMAEEVTEDAMGVFVGPRDGVLPMPYFELDLTAMQGKTLVVTETLYDYDSGEAILVHEDLLDEEQTVYIPKVTTTAKDSKTNTHTGTLGKTEQVIDVVVMENLIVGQTYEVNGTLVYKEDCVDVNGVSHKAGDVIATHPAVTIVATDPTMTVEIVFDVDATLLEGVSGVVFEDLYHNGILVAPHHDLDSEEQTVNWPKVRTLAKDDLSGTHTGVARADAVVIDTVSLTNLTVGETYRVDGVLMDQATGLPFVDAAGNEIYATSEAFEAAERDMTKELTFAFDATDLENVTVVVFEKLICLSKDDADTDIETEVAQHKDLTDEGQSIHFPEGHTNASDSATGDEVGMNAEEAVIVDVVSYKNLAVGETYTVKGTLHYKEDGTDAAGNTYKAGDEVKDETDKPYYSETTFVPETPDGSITMTFTVNSELLRGKSVVVFEDFCQGEVKVYAHADIEDDDQRIDYPDVKTTAVSDNTGDHVGDTDETSTITDIVELTGLTVGMTYNVHGTLMDKETNAAVLDADGNAVEAETEEFVATAAEMTVELVFTLDAKAREAKTTVVFEDLIHNDVVVSCHTDIDDEGQSVHHPKVTTTAEDAETEDHIGRPRKETKIVDVVEMDNLIVGQTYTITGVLMDQATNKPYVDADGKEVRPEPITLKATKSKETKEMVFVFNGSNLEGTTVTVFEDLQHNDYTVAVHHDINSEPQSVHFPKIGTTATDAATKDHVAVVSEKAVIKDEVRFENLEPGLEYVMNGRLVIRGEEKTVLAKASLRFKPTEANGFVTLSFEFDASGLDGFTAVAFEYLSFGDVEIAKHEEPDDEDQSVHFPKVETTAKDLTTDEHQGYSGPTQIEDVVQLSNLIVGQTYDVSGVLMDKETRLPVLDADGNEIRARVDGIVATKTDMEVTLVFTLDAKIVAGRTCVVFEDLLHNGLYVASHADIEDEDQTVSYPSIRTTAVDKETGTHTAVKKGIVTVLDTVAYTNLKPGTYVMRGTLMVKATGQPMTDEAGRPLVTEKRFEVTAENESGEVVLPFVFNTSRMIGSDVVVFEKLFKVTGSDKPSDSEGEEEPENLIPVADHEDMDDEGQTVSYIPQKVPSPKTGDPANWMLWAALAALAMIGISIMLIHNSKKDNTRD